MSTWTDSLTMDTMAKERANPPFDVRKVPSNFVSDKQLHAYSISKH